MSEPRTLLAPNPGPMTLDGTRTYVVGHARPAVIDPGPDDGGHVRAILDALGGAIPVAILLTHAHADHSAAAPVLAGATGAPVLAAPGAFHPLLPDGAVARWLNGGDSIETDAGELVVIPTPGHAPDHVAFHHPPTGALFVGDAFMGEGDTTLVSPPEGDLTDYLETLDRVAALAPSVLYPAHGPPLADPAEAVARYRRHREDRIGTVVRALRRTGPATPEALVDEVYGAELDPRLRTAAAGSLHAIFAYLLSTGRAADVGGGRIHLADTE